LKSPQLGVPGDSAGDLIQICNTPFCPFTDKGKATLERCRCTTTTGLANRLHAATRFPAFRFIEIDGFHSQNG
jgi:hypothetical protein